MEIFLVIDKPSKAVVAAMASRFRADQLVQKCRSAYTKTMQVHPPIFDGIEDKTLFEISVNNGAIYRAGMTTINVYNYSKINQYTPGNTNIFVWGNDMVDAINVAQGLLTKNNAG